AHVIGHLDSQVAVLLILESANIAALTNNFNTGEPLLNFFGLMGRERHALVGRNLPFADQSDREVFHLYSYRRYGLSFQEASQQGTSLFAPVCTVRCECLDKFSNGHRLQPDFACTGERSHKDSFTTEYHRAEATHRLHIEPDLWFKGHHTTGIHTQGFVVEGFLNYRASGVHKCFSITLKFL